MTSNQKEKLNEIARKFYRAHGYITEKGYDFSKATHPQEKDMWRMALLSFSFWQEYMKDM